jgi:hypothetical protein
MEVEPVSKVQFLQQKSGMMDKVYKTYSTPMYKGESVNRPQMEVKQM